MADAPIEPNSSFNKITLSGKSDIFWNGRRVTAVQLRDLLKATRDLQSEPELRFQPDRDADYELSAKVLNIIKESGVGKFGFVGNELYSSSDKRSD
jgi:biopolymer transport protein ExbD